MPLLYRRNNALRQLYTSPSPPLSPIFGHLLLLFTFHPDIYHTFGPFVDSADMPKRNAPALSSKTGTKRTMGQLTIQPRTAAESVYAVPEVRQRVLRYLDLPTLCSFIRVEKAVSHDVAQELYREVPYKHMLNKMSRSNVSHRSRVRGVRAQDVSPELGGTPTGRSEQDVDLSLERADKQKRRLFNCDAVRTVRVEDEWLTAAVFKDMFGRAHFELVDGHLSHIGRDYRPSAILAAIKVARKKCPGVRLLHFTGRHFNIHQGSRFGPGAVQATWDVRIDPSGDSGSIIIHYTKKSPLDSPFTRHSVPLTPGFDTQYEVTYEAEPLAADGVPQALPAVIVLKHLPSFPLELTRINLDAIAIELSTVIAFVARTPLVPGHLDCVRFPAGSSPCLTLPSYSPFFPLSATGSKSFSSRTRSTRL